MNVKLMIVVQDTTEAHSSCLRQSDTIKCSHAGKTHTAAHTHRAYVAQAMLMWRLISRQSTHAPGYS